MSWFRKTKDSQVVGLEDNKQLDKLEESERQGIVDEEGYIWAEGYTALGANMLVGDIKCELYKQCETKVNNFIFCKQIKELFDWSELNGKNRFFKVKALVQKTDNDNYYEMKRFSEPEFHYGFPTYYETKRGILAKLIILEEELTYSNGLKNYIHNKFAFIESEQDYELLKRDTYISIRKKKFIAELEGIGYSEIFSNILYDEKAKLVDNRKIEDTLLKKLLIKAKAFKEEGLSKEMSVYLLLKA